jgi:hypothetical protein
LWYPVWGLMIPPNTQEGKAGSSTMGRRDQLLDAAGEILAARPDAAKKNEGNRNTRRSPIDEGAEPRATRLDDAFPPSLLEALRTLSLAITGWYQLPDDAVPSIAGRGGERAEDDIAYLEQAQTEAADHMKAAARALEAATEYAASLRSRASSGPEHR